MVKIFGGYQLLKPNEKETTLSHQLKPLPRVSLLLENHHFSGKFLQGYHSEAKCHLKKKKKIAKEKNTNGDRIISFFGKKSKGAKRLFIDIFSKASLERLLEVRGRMTKLRGTSFLVKIILGSPLFWV